MQRHRHQHEFVAPVLGAVGRQLLEVELLAQRQSQQRQRADVQGAFILEIVGNIMLLSSIVSEYLIGAIQGAIIIIAMLVQRSLIRKS